ncbi:BnaA01g05640D [Brassica napus]|uniref:BnaA01g05640D protein n=2 Tax=Brassica TaxID=3705 RepID=A0A078HVY0_BRANA|nr:BnaA01g05640D [Brassica napus]
MPKRKAKEVVRLTEEENKDKEIRREEKKHEEEDTNLERRIDAIKAISEEQLETPVLDFFKENLPDVSIEVEDNGEIEFKWNHNTGDSSLGG